MTPEKGNDNFDQSGRCYLGGRSGTVLEARVIIDDWRCDYNAKRPHSAHGELTPTSHLGAGGRTRSKN